MKVQEMVIRNDFCILPTKISTSGKSIKNFERDEGSIPAWIFLRIKFWSFINLDLLVL